MRNSASVHALEIIGHGAGAVSKGSGLRVKGLGLGSWGCSRSWVWAELRIDKLELVCFVWLLLRISSLGWRVEGVEALD